MTCPPEVPIDMMQAVVAGAGIGLIFGRLKGVVRLGPFGAQAAPSLRTVQLSVLGSPKRVFLPGVERARVGTKSAFRAHLGRSRRAFRSQRSGLLSFVAIPVQLRTTVVRRAVRSSIHKQDGQFLRSRSGELRRSPAWAERSAACTSDRWRDKRPRGAAMDGCGFSTGYGESLHIAPHGRSLQTRPFFNDLNCLARCAAFAP